MADTKISALTELAAEPAADDELVVVDKSDTTMAASGTDKRLRYDRISGPGIFRPHRRTGAILESVPRMHAGTAVTITTQVVSVCLCHELLRAGVTYTSITFESGGTAMVTGTNQWFSLIKASDRTTLRSTVDDTSTAWSNNAEKTLALSSTYTPTVDTEIYLGIMVKATTVPNIRAHTHLATAAFVGRVPILSGTSSTGQTTPPADATALAAITATTSMLFGYVS